MKLYFPLFPDEESQATFAAIENMYQEYLDARCPKPFRQAISRATWLPVIITFVGIWCILWLYQDEQIGPVAMSFIFLCLSIGIMLLNQGVIQPFYAKRYIYSQEKRISEVRAFFQDPETSKALQSLLAAMSSQYTWYENSENYNRHFEAVDNTDYRYFHKEYLCYQAAYKETLSFLQQIQKTFLPQQTRV